MASPPLDNAFQADFLAELEERDAPPGAAEAETAGPWGLRRAADGYELVRPWEAAERGDPPFGVFAHWDTALYFLAGLPAAGRSAIYTLAEERSAQGYRLFREGQPEGYLALPQGVEAASVLAAVGRSVVGQAAFLTAAGPWSLAKVGQILGRRELERILGGGF